MHRKKHFIETLVTAINCGAWNADEIEQRLNYALGKTSLDTKSLARTLQEKLKSTPYPGSRKLKTTIAEAPEFIKWAEKTKRPPEEIRVNLDMPDISACEKFALNTELPKLRTRNELASWLKISPNDLAWFADHQNRREHIKKPKLSHYHYKWIKKSDGTYRLLETPKSALKSIQKQILANILNHVRPHDAAHGFLKGRSCITHAQDHCGQAVLIKMDLKNFFQSIHKKRVGKLFLDLGYPYNVATSLAALCTNTPSRHLLGTKFELLSWQAKKITLSNHLPQGAPTSPAISNLCAQNLDIRLEGLASKLNATYSRYADDLAFSGGKDLKKNFSYIRKRVEYIGNEEGFLINHAKTCIKTQSQNQSLTGVTVNRHTNISRKDFDTLKATLYNCVRTSPTEQNHNQVENFKEHLRGKISHINAINPQKGRKLREIFEKIDWRNQ